MVEQRAVPVRNGLQLLQELREEPDVILLDLHQLLDFLRPVLVM